MDNSLSMCMCISKKEQKYTVVAEIFVAIKVTVLEIKIWGDSIFQFKKVTSWSIYIQLLVKKTLKDLILLINIFQDGYEIEFLNKDFCF